MTPPGLEAKVNAAVIKKLSNATVTFDTRAVAGIFSDAFKSAELGGAFGMAASQPSVVMLTSDVPAAPVGVSCTVECVLLPSVTHYTIAAHEPDGAGMSRILLEAA